MKAIIMLNLLLIELELARLLRIEDITGSDTCSLIGFIIAIMVVIVVVVVVVRSDISPIATRGVYFYLDRLSCCCMAKPTIVR